MPETIRAFHAFTGQTFRRRPTGTSAITRLRRAGSILLIPHGIECRSGPYLLSSAGTHFDTLKKSGIPREFDLVKTIG